MKGFEGASVSFGPEANRKESSESNTIRFEDFTAAEKQNLEARIVSQMPWNTEGLEHPVFKDMSPALLTTLRAVSQAERDTSREKEVLAALDLRYDRLLEEEA